MATNWTPEQIATSQAWAKGKTGAEIASFAQSAGLSAADVDTLLGYTPGAAASTGYGTSAGLKSDVAKMTYTGAPTPAPAPAPIAAPVPAPAPVAAPKPVAAAPAYTPAPMVPPPVAASAPTPTYTPAPPPSVAPTYTPAPMVPPPPVAAPAPAPAPSTPTFNLATQAAGGGISYAPDSNLKAAVPGIADWISPGDTSSKMQAYSTALGYYGGNASDSAKQNLWNSAGLTGDYKKDATVYTPAPMVPPPAPTPAPAQSFNLSAIAAPAPAPVAAPVQAPVQAPVAKTQTWTPEQIATSQAWSRGKTGAEIAAFAKNAGLTAADVDTLLGYKPGTASSFGYGTDAGLSDAAASAVYSWTPEQIKIAQDWSRGKTGAEIAAFAKNAGLSASDVDTLLGFQSGATATTGYGTDAGLIPTLQNQKFGAFYNPEWIASAKAWSVGKSAAEVLAKARELGMTADEVGNVFGFDGNNLAAATGYGGTLKTADGTDLSKWTYDAQKGWVYPQAGGTGGSGTPTGGTGAPTGGTTAPPTNQWNPSAPATGINLSQVQNATPWQVAQNQTVAKQIEQIIAADSPLMQQARMRALQAANQRGLLNSSMAVSAGESALYDAAMPIAQQDAATYADAARFNADATNTFSRDNNAFVRDAFMADFNMAANEWAKKQDQIRNLETLSVQNRYTLERDAIQNGYQSARDAILNGYTVARDEANNAFTLKRDEGQNAFTKSQQDAQNAYAAVEAEKDRVAAAQRAAMGVSTPQADTSVLRTQMQIDAEKERINAEKVSNATTNLNNYKTKWGTSIIDIQNSNLSEAQKTAALVKLTDTYAPIVSAYATQAGINPEGAVKDLRFTAEPAASTNVVNTVVQGGGSGPNATFDRDGG